MIEPIGHLLESVQLIVGVYDSASSVKTGKGKFTTVNELTDQVPAVRPEVLRAAVEVLMSLGPRPDSIATKVLSEEDKGAVLAGLFSTQARLPLAMARHNVPYEIPGSLVVPLSMEYMNAHLTVNGIRPGDRLLLIDDTLASCGTMIALINAARSAGADVVDVRVVVEKLRYGGREAVFRETGLIVKAGIGITVSDEGQVKAVQAFGRPIAELEAV